MVAGRFRSLSAATVVVALVWIVSTPVTPAGAVASWAGRVFEADRITPREGVVVSLAAPQGGNALRSGPTRADGAFAIDAAPAGTYRLKVETPEGLFVSADPVKLEAGANAPMALTLNPRLINAKQEHGLGGEGFSRTTEFLIAGAVTLVALFAIYKVTEDEDEVPASVF